MLGNIPHGFVTYFGSVILKLDYFVCIYASILRTVDSLKLLLDCPLLFKLGSLYTIPFRTASNEGLWFFLIGGEPLAIQLTHDLFFDDFHYNN